MTNLQTNDLHDVELYWKSRNLDTAATAKQAMPRKMAGLEKTRCRQPQRKQLAREPWGHLHLRYGQVGDQ